MVGDGSVISVWKRESANEIITHRWHFQHSATDDIGCSIRKQVDIDDNIDDLVKRIKCRDSVGTYVSDHIGF